MDKAVTGPDEDLDKVYQVADVVTESLRVICI
jgi:hypothetical protein